EVREMSPRLRPLHCRTQLAPFDDHDPPGVDPLHGTALAAALLVEAVEELGGPDLAVSGDEVAHIARRGARQFHGVENALEVVAIAVEAREIQSCGLRAEERLGDLRMARAQGAELHPIAVVLALRQRYEPQQGIC